MTRIAVIFIRIYQTLISPYLGNNCRFYPTCSNYALSVYQEWGFFRGTLLTVKRLLKCGFWNPGGIDLPPKKIREVK